MRLVVQILTLSCVSENLHSTVGNIYYYYYYLDLYIVETGQTICKTKHYIIIVIITTIIVIIIIIIILIIIIITMN